MDTGIFKDYPDIISVKQLQTMLKIGRNSAYKLLSDGKIKTIKIGKKYIIPKIYVINYIYQNG